MFKKSSTTRLRAGRNSFSNAGEIKNRVTPSMVSVAFSATCVNPRDAGQTSPPPMSTMAPRHHLRESVLLRSRDCRAGARRQWRSGSPPQGVASLSRPRTGRGWTACYGYCARPPMPAEALYHAAPPCSFLYKNRVPPHRGRISRNSLVTSYLYHSIFLIAPSLS